MILGKLNLTFHTGALICLPQGPEPAFQRVPGVLATRVGYTGGKTNHPTYSSVCSGRTGHSEAIKIVFDPDQISYEELVSKFFAMHNYAAKAKPQYMSAIFAQTEEQRKIAEAKIKSIGGPVATEIKDMTSWFDAEEYHQNYLNKRFNSRL